MRKVGEGSAKDLFLDETAPEHVFFKFSDRVSVFDYGALTDSIPHKGANLTRFAKKIFSHLHSEAIPTAFDLELSENSEALAMLAAAHPKFPDLKGTLSFIPLEVIFRFGVPPGSSLVRRRPDLKVFDRFEKPLVEFSTKLESQDRLLNRNEAASLAGGESELKKLEDYTEKLCLSLKGFFKSCGLELWDGKIECARTASGDILMVDAITPDELRLSFPGLEKIPLSKDLLRMWLGGTSWASDIARIKNQKGEAWKEYTLPEPPRLGVWRQEKLSGLYEALALTVETKNSKSLLEWLRKDKSRPKVKIIGSGGREAALKDRLEQEGADIVESDAASDCVFVSPDAELADGLVDKYQKQGAWTYGPRKEAAKVEWSKDFGREIAAAANIPIPFYTSDPSDFKKIREKFQSPPVVKKDGLAAGKGVVVCETFEEAEEVIEKFSKDGSLLLEERLRGFEASAFFACENGYYGSKVFYLGTAKDFKRRLPGDEGPNTGGMGAYAPHPDVSAQDEALFETWALQTVEVLAKRGLPFHGILYLGLIKDEKKGWSLIEYNARFGDPETQALTLLWPQGEEVLKSLLAVSVRAPSPIKLAAKNTDDAVSVMCLALVNPDYPESTKNLVNLPPWEPQKPVKLFRTQSLTGRVAYLVTQAPNLQQAGDQLFEALVDSPWKDLLDWRPDILK